MVETAQSAKAPIQGVADKIARYFVPSIVILAIIAWIYWFSFSYSNLGKRVITLPPGVSRFQFAFNFGISTLVIACPCALGLATPTAVMVGTGIAASFGVLIKGGDVLEKINGITTVVFDKTGTLTSGKPLVKDFIDVVAKFKYELPASQKEMTLDDLYHLTYLAESQSEHPLAQAIVKHVKDQKSHFESTYALKEFKNINGEGISAKIIHEGEELQVVCGNERLMERFNVNLETNAFHMNMQALESAGKTVVCLAVN